MSRLTSFFGAPSAAASSTRTPAPAWRVGVGLLLVALVVGSTLMGCATALRAIVTTEGNDIVNLMTAVDAFKKAFRIQVIVILVSTALGVVVFLAGMM